MLVLKLFIVLLNSLAVTPSGEFPSAEESGQALIEYALIMVFVAVLVILLLSILGPAVYNMFETIYNSMAAV